MIGIIGAGSWGVALGHILGKAGQTVYIWGRNTQKITRLQKTKQHSSLPDCMLSDNLIFTSDIQLLAQSQIIILAIPVQSIQDVLPLLDKIIHKNTLLIQTAKGIDIQTELFPYQIMKNNFPQHNIALLSGPGFAIELAKKLPTAVTIASQEEQALQKIQNLFKHTNLRTYISNDCIGVSLGGAIKNVLALACGMVEGINLGHSAKASITARGIAEMVRLGACWQTNQQTLMGLSGLGDIVLSCNSLHSRNYALGYTIGQANDHSWHLPASKTVEGIWTAKALHNIALKENIELPLCEAVYHITTKQKNLKDTIETLMERPLKPEFS